MPQAPDSFLLFLPVTKRCRRPGWRWRLTGSAPPPSPSRNAPFATSAKATKSRRVSAYAGLAKARARFINRGEYNRRPNPPPFLKDASLLHTGDNASAAEGSQVTVADCGDWVMPPFSWSHTASALRRLQRDANGGFLTAQVCRKRGDEKHESLLRPTGV